MIKVNPEDSEYVAQKKYTGFLLRMKKRLARNLRLCGFKEISINNILSRAYLNSSGYRGRTKKNNTAKLSKFRHPDFSDDFKLWIEKNNNIKLQLKREKNAVSIYINNDYVGRANENKELICGYILNYIAENPNLSIVQEVKNLINNITKTNLSNLLYLIMIENNEK